MRQSPKDQIAFIARDCAVVCRPKTCGGCAHCVHGSFDIWGECRLFGSALGAYASKKPPTQFYRCSACILAEAKFKEGRVIA